MAQAFSRLGSKVSLIHSKEALLQRECNQAQECIKDTFQEEGIELYLNASIENIKYENTFKIQGITSSSPFEISSEQVMACVGRQPNLDLDLEKANIAYTDQGIAVDAFSKTTNQNVYAVGDVTGPPYFTHLAESHARSVLTSLLLPIPCKKTTQAIPKVTFTDPEVASFGLSYDEAVKKYRKKSLKVYKIELKEVDRGLTSSLKRGFVEVITKTLSSKILGATIVAESAGEMIQELSVAKYAKLPLRKLAKLIHPYPTLSLAIRKAADLWLIEVLLPFLKNPLRFL